MINHVELNEAYLTLMDKSKDLVVLINPDCTIKYITKSVRQTFSLTTINYPDLKLEHVIHPEDLPVLKEQITEVLKSGVAHIDFQSRCMSQSGKYNWVDGQLINMLAEDGINAILMRFTDISKHKQCIAEKDVMIKELHKRNEEQNQFVYIISHNLRTPLSNLLGLISVLDMDLLDNYNKSIISLFKNALDMLNETIFDLIQILSLNNDGAQLTNVNIQDVFLKVCNALNDQISQPDVSVIANFNLKHVVFNKSYLESVLLNLMSNSVKYRDDQRALQINIHLDTDENDKCVLTYKDNGIGIDLDDNTKDKVFGLHQRFHSHVSGNGVGLYITKSQITALGGQIDVYSKVNEGTTFKITFQDKLTPAASAIIS